MANSNPLHNFLKCATLVATIVGANVLPRGSLPIVDLQYERYQAASYNVSQEQSTPVPEHSSTPDSSPFVLPPAPALATTSANHKPHTYSRQETTSTSPTSATLRPRLTPSAGNHPNPQPKTATQSKTRAALVYARKPDHDGS